MDKIFTRYCPTCDNETDHILRTIQTNHELDKYLEECLVCGSRLTGAIMKSQYYFFRPNV